MKYLLATLAVLATSPAFAHPGHMDVVDGHAHSATELFLMGGVPALVAIIGFAAVAIFIKCRND